MRLPARTLENVIVEEESFKKTGPELDAVLSVKVRDPERVRKEEVATWKTPPPCNVAELREHSRVPVTVNLEFE